MTYTVIKTNPTVVDATAVPAPPTPSGGGSKFFVIAASDTASTQTAFQGMVDAADLVCTGTGDGTQINAFLADKFFVTIYFLYGTYDIDATVLSNGCVFIGVAATSFVNFVASGSNMPVVKLDNSFAEMHYIGISGGGLSKNNIGINMVSKTTVTNCKISNVANAGIQGDTIDFTGGDNLLIFNNQLDTCGLNGTSGAISLDDTIRSTVQSNWIVSNSGHGISGTAVVTGPQQNRIINNHVGFNSKCGIVLTPGSGVCSQNMVIGNHVRNNGQHGIQIGTSTGTATDHMVIANQVLNNSTQTNITFDNIRIEGSNNSEVQQNMCRVGSGTKRPKYGINVVSGSKNWVTNNDLLTGGLTAAFNDTGTSTNTTAGNRTV